MHVLRIEHPVPDFEAWKRAFHSDPIGRARLGVRRYRVYRSGADPGDAIVELEFDSLAEVEECLKALRELWGRVQGTVMSDPRVHVYSLVEERRLTDAATGSTPATLARGLTPILNVSDMAQSFAWFEKLGWSKGWDWGTPPTFGGVCSGEYEIFLCLGGQGGRGRTGAAATFGPGSDEAAEKGVWMSIWVEDVDAVHRRCLEHGIEVTWPPTDMPWNVREMHVRHPDGHVFRISRGR